MTASRITGAFTGSRTLPPIEERMGALPTLPDLPTPEPRPAGYFRHPWRRTRPNRGETSRSAATRKAEERTAAGLPAFGRAREVIPGRPLCHRCQVPATSRGISPNGKRRRWKCSKCKVRWSTETAPVGDAKP